MPVLRTKINPQSDAFAANAQRMRDLLAEVQRLEGMVIAESESKRAKFEKRKQILPRERVARLLVRGTPFLEPSRLAGLNMLDGGGQKWVVAPPSALGWWPVNAAWSRSTTAPSRAARSRPWV